MATRFHDRHEWIDFLKAQEVARRIVADPSMIEDARRFIDKFMRPDPHQRDYVVMWDELLSKSPAQVAAALAEDSPRTAASGNRPGVWQGADIVREVAELMAHADAPAFDIDHILRAAASRYRGYSQLRHGRHRRGDRNRKTTYPP